MKFKKAASLLLAGAIATSAMSFSASALSYQYTLEDLETAPVVFAGTPASMGADGKLDPLWDKADAIELKAMGNSIRIGLEGDMKLMWDKDNLHMLVTVRGDSSVKAPDNSNFNTASWEDMLTVMVSQTWATLDPEAEEIYQRDTFDDSDIAFETHRMADGNNSRIVKAASWGGDNGAIIEGVTSTVLDKIKTGIQSHEINDGTTSFKMQITIPWVDKTLVEDGRIIGLDVDYGDWLGMGETYDGVFAEGSKVGKPHMYFSDNYAEGLDNPASNAPVILSAIPVGMDPDAAIMMTMLNSIPDKADITLEDEEAIKLIRTMYNSLTDDQKAQVADSYARLTGAEAKITELKNGQTEPPTTDEPTQPDTKPTTNKPADDNNPQTGEKGMVLPALVLAGVAGAVVRSRKKSTR